MAGPGADGLELTAKSFDTDHSTFVERFLSWIGFGGTFPLYRDCAFNDEPTPTGRGDFVGAIVYRAGRIAPGHPWTVSFLYHRI